MLIFYLYSKKEFFGFFLYGQWFLGEFKSLKLFELNVSNGRSTFKTNLDYVTIFKQITITKNINTAYRCQAAIPYWQIDWLYDWIK